MKKIFLILQLLIAFSVIAQNKSITGRVSSDTLPGPYKMDISFLRKHINDGIPNKYKTAQYARINYEFSDNIADNVLELISSGFLYSDWPELENYVNKILKKVIPKELENDTMIHAYIVKNGNFNAFMTPTGQMFINIGVFAYINDEATLAGILAHEMAHYYKDHGYLGFIEIEYQWNTLGGQMGLKKRRNNFSVKQEFEADSLAMVWLNNSEYHISGLLKSFQIMQRLEKREIRLLKDKWHIEKSTHPLSVDRLKKMQDFFKNVNDNHQLFLVDQDLFLKLKEESKAEILKYLLSSFQHNGCIEAAFKFHLVEPDNPTYIYYLMESVRRLCYLNPELWNKNFITYRYFEDKENENQLVKIEMKNDFFEKMDHGILALSSQDLAQFRATFYWEPESKKIKTNEEAFDFFYQIGKLLNCKECILSNALSTIKHSETRNSLLKEYLSSTDILYRSFAERLLKDSITESLQDRKLLVFNNFFVFINQGQSRVEVRNFSDSQASELIFLFDSVTKYTTNRTPLFLPGLKDFNLNDYMMFKELNDFSNDYLISKQKAKLHILNPSYLDLFFRYEVNEIEFLNCRYMEYRKKEKSVDAYDEALSLDYRTIFNHTKRTRYFEVYISSVREVPNGFMKIRYYGGESKLNFNRPSFNQLVWEIKYKIDEKEKRAKRLDYSF